MHSSFHGFVKYYNKIMINKTAFPEKQLDEKNFQINWILYTVLKLLFLWGDQDTIEIPYSLYNTDEVDTFFYRHKNKLYKSFVKYWSDYPLHKSSNCTTNCTDIVIVNGHKKTARSTCTFNNCYDNTIEELGPVLVGCPKSVFKQSEIDLIGLCKRHTDVVAEFGKHAMEFDPSDDMIDNSCNVKRNELFENRNRLII